jgi:hypothetical protein
LDDPQHRAPRHRHRRADLPATGWEPGHRGPVPVQPRGLQPPRREPGPTDR